MLESLKRDGLPVSPCLVSLVKLLEVQVDTLILALFLVALADLEPLGESTPLQVDSDALEVTERDRRRFP